jgi:hypothetical protein
VRSGDDLRRDDRRVDANAARSPDPRIRGASPPIDFAPTPANAADYRRMLVEVGGQYLVVQLDGPDRETIALPAREVGPRAGREHR